MGECDAVAVVFSAGRQEVTRIRAYESRKKTKKKKVAGSLLLSIKKSLSKVRGADGLASP